LVRDKGRNNFSHPTRKEFDCADGNYLGRIDAGQARDLPPERLYLLERPQSGVKDYRSAVPLERV
jgi:hypothetical protein